MTGSTAGDGASVLELSPEERDERGVTDDEVRDVLVERIRQGTQREKIFVDLTLPALELDYEDVSGANNHPVVFRNCTFEDGISAVHADVNVPLRFDGSTVGGASLEQARFEYDVSFREVEFTGAVDGFEARFDRDADFAGATFDAPVTMDEAVFHDDASFAGATFGAAVSFRAAAFHGTSNELEDHASFAGAVFEDEANFRQATVEYSTFRETVFHGRAMFEESRFDGDVDFDGVTFRDEADFDEADFGEDASFEGAAFRGDAVFRGAEFEGGARSLQDDARFVDAVFDADANFRDAHFRYVNFEGTTFAGHAMFEEAWFDADADFAAAVFEGETDFDEARFVEDADFAGTRFEAPAVFRGAAFRGDANHLEDNATFEGAIFEDDADFDEAKFTSANFTGVRFGGAVDFSGVEFVDHLAFAPEAAGDVCVDFTDAILRDGSIEQPGDHWVWFDLTRASLGDVSLSAAADGGEHELLDYFRFCNTEFSEFDGYEFDFSEHTPYLDRNDWELHTFDGADPDREYAIEMTPAVIETTYLKAKNAASATGNMKAAGEFRVKRQRYAREKHVEILRDPASDAGSRLRNLSRAVENYFMEITCGYGMRLFRIMAVFLVVPLFPALLYAFGGPMFRTGAGQLDSLSQLATPAGQSIMYKNVHFSYITFLTIGYGGIGPEGALARMLAGLEVYLSVILGGLVLYALIKRSEL